MARKGCYLYVQTIGLFLRLNLSDLCESGSSAEFEIAYDYSTSYGRVPVGMGCIVVDSKIYMVGGENTQKGRLFRWDWGDDENWLNTKDVYVFDPTKPESEDRLVPVRDGAVAGKLNGPKAKPIVFTLEGKFYVLCQTPFLEYIDDPECPFEVFDPTLPVPSWKALPHQPPHEPKFPVTGYFAWGHKLLAFPEISIFDARDEKWEDGWDFVKQFKRTPFPYGAAVEFKGVVFAVSDINALVAYDLNASGQLRAHWVLDELSEVFEGRPIDDPSRGFLTHIGGGRMCLLFTWHDEHSNWFIRVQVFQVYITIVDDSPDRPAIKREIMRTFDLRSWNGTSVIYSVFMCDHSNKSDIEADASSGLYSCEDLKKRAEHAVEYVKGDSKKPKTTAPE